MGRERHVLLVAGLAGLAAVALLLVLGRGGGGPEESAAPVTPAADRSDVVLIGDSQVERGLWSDLLGMPVDNQGVSGLEIDEVTALVGEAVPGDVRTVVVWAGTNDVLREGAGQVGPDMTALLDAVAGRAPSARVVLLAVPPLPDAPGETRAANEALADAADRAGAVLLDVSDVLSHPGHMHPDGVHLSETGYQAVGELLADVLGIPTESATGQTKDPPTETVGGPFTVT